METAFAKQPLASRPGVASALLKLSLLMNVHKVQLSSTFAYKLHASAFAGSFVMSQRAC